MRKTIWVVAAMFAAMMALSAGHASSTECNGGTAAPAGGLSVKQTGPQGTPPAATGGTIAACSKDAQVPVRGSIVLKGTVDGANTNGYIDVDGDSNTQNPPVGGNCADGFFRVSGSSAGPKFYESKDGNYTDTKPGTAGNQTAQAEGPDVWATNIAHNCSGQ
jgi:hypothetical protein